MILSKKQINLFKDITSPNVPNISVLGSTQSGKTYDICFAMIEYARALNEYEKEQRKNKEYVPREYNGAIIGWTTDTIKSNIVDNILNILEKEYKFKNGKEFILKYGMQDKYLEIYNIKFYFFGFNNKLSFNKILGKPLIFVWVDEAARIYTQGQLRESFNEIPGRMMSYSGHPFYKRIDSFNVEGSQSHPYKKEYIDKRDWKKYVFYPYDNPVLDTKEKIREAVKAFPEGSLREQKVFNKWVVGSGKVFTIIPKIKYEEFKENYIIREIGIGCDYGSSNPTTFGAIALAQNTKNNRWELIMIDSYYHDPKIEGDTPTTEFYSNQIKQFITFLQKKYVGIHINTLVIDSEAAHFDNRLTVDGIRHELAKKNNLTVDKSVQLMQSLFYKELLKKIEMPSIKYFMGDIPIYAGHDIGLEELESYHYDELKSEREGINCYVKEFDHYIDGCLKGDTLIKTDNGDIPIKDLVGKEGMLFAFNGKEFEKKKFKDVRITQQNADIYELTLSNGYKIRGTYNHPVLTTKGYKYLGELTKEDNVVCYRVEEVLKSTNIEKLKNVEIAQVSEVRKIGKDNVYNMEVEDLHNYIANGIVVHNCRYLIMEYSLTGRAPIV